MSKNTKTNLVYFLLILKSIQKIFHYSEDLESVEEFYGANDGMNFDACITQLAQIAESMKKIDIDLQERYTLIPWKNIIGFRNRIVHDYNEIDINKVYKIVTDEIIDLENILWTTIDQEINLGNFDIEEYQIAKGSDFYESIKFKF